VRELTEDVVSEGCMREYYTVGGNKIEVEPKEKMKEKTGRSPDLADAVAIGLEGARQRGFVIRNVANRAFLHRASSQALKWLSEEHIEKTQGIKLAAAQPIHWLKAVGDLNYRFTNSVSASAARRSHRSHCRPFPGFIRSVTCWMTDSNAAPSTSGREKRPSSIPVCWFHQ
jgi:hypothetical protein